MTFHVPENNRIMQGPRASSMADGNNGMFRVALSDGCSALCVASNRMGWEHVSVSLYRHSRGRKRYVSANRSPTWHEMCQIKALFWDGEDRVVQFHPPESEYVNFHPFVLHLWQPVGVDMPHPDSILVGPK